MGMEKYDGYADRTDSRGRFTVDGLVPGKHTLVVSDPKQGFRNKEFTFKVKRNTTGKVLRLTR